MLYCANLDQISVLLPFSAGLSHVRVIYNTGYTYIFMYNSMYIIHLTYIHKYVCVCCQYSEVKARRRLHILF